MTDTDGHPDLIYKICPSEDWRQACASGLYTGSVDDQRDGFIHFSTKDQVTGTLAKHFAGQDNLLLLAVPTDVLDPQALKFEVSRNGMIFPHLYGPFDPAAITASYAIRWRDTGHHEVEY